jgi:serine protease Do
MRAEVIGINTAIVSRTRGLSLTGSRRLEGIGLAIPSNMAKDVMEQLIEKGKVVRGYLGVLPQDVDEELAKSFNLPHMRGALVADVPEGGPADEAGLKEGDFIVAINGRAVANGNELRNVVASVRSGKTVPVEFYRDGKKKTVKVKIRQRPEEIAAAFGREELTKETAVERFGLNVVTLTREFAERHDYDSSLRGVLITEVAPGSDAAEQHLREGMVITRVQGRAVETAEDFAEALSAKDAVVGVRLRVVEPSGVRRFVFITPTK